MAKKDKSKEKINESCIKIFKLLSLLYEDNATYNNVIDIFKDEPGSQSTNNLQVVLNKYINTLKVFGFKIKKENNKYSMDGSFYFIDYSPEELKSISILMNSGNNFPDEDCRKNINDLVHNLVLRMDSDTKNMLNGYSQNYDFSFYYEGLRNQINYCKDVCKRHQQALILYKRNKKEIEIVCEPKDVVYDSKTAYLQVYDVNKHTKLNIPIPSIFSVNFIPRMSSSSEKMPMVVVYKLKNRLAKAYKLKDNEYSRGLDKDGNQIIVNKDEPFNQLMSRLMRYSYNCEILTPKFLRDEMLEQINETLKNYEE